MKNHNSLTPREAMERSASNVTQCRLAATAVEQARLTIAHSEIDTANDKLDAHRRAIGAWHVQYWTEHELPNRENELQKAETKAAHDYHANEAAYYAAALAQAMLDGVDIKQ